MRNTLTFLLLASITAALRPAAAATLSVADLGPNDLVITEYLADPVGVSDAAAEYFEIFNTRTEPLDVAGLVVRDDGTNSFVIASLTIPARSFAVLSNGDGTDLGFVPDYSYGGTMSLTNGADEISLVLPDDSLVHRLVYDDGDFFGDGVAHELDRIDSDTPAIVTGPAAGSDFLAASQSLPLGNFGSPGSAGTTVIDLPAVPVPAAAWLYASGLGVLAIRRRRAFAKLRHIPPAPEPRNVTEASAATDSPRGTPAIDAARLGQCDTRHRRRNVHRSFGQ